MAMTTKKMMDAYNERQKNQVSKSENNKSTGNKPGGKSPSTSKSIDAPPLS